MKGLIIFLVIVAAVSGCNPLLPFIGSNRLDSEMSGKKDEKNDTRTENNQLNVKFSGGGIDQQAEALTEIIRARAEARERIEKARAELEDARRQAQEAEARRQEAETRRLEQKARLEQEQRKWKDRAIWAFVAAGGLLLANFLSGGWLWRKAQAYRARLHAEEAEHKKALREGIFEKEVNGAV